MSEDVASRLRELARDHSEERLNLSSYRRLRAPLLDSLGNRGAGADGPEVITQPRAAAVGAAKAARAVAPSSAPPPAAPRVASQPAAPAPTQPPTTEARKPVLVTGLVLFGAVVAVGTWLALGKLHQAVPAATGAGAASGAADGQTDPLRAELQGLLDSDDWSAARLSRVNTLLVEAGPERIRALAGTEWFQRFTEAVHQRVKEQQALGAPLTPDKSPLAALAATIGLEVAAPAEERRPETATAVAGGASAAPKAPAQGTPQAAPAGGAAPTPAPAAAATPAPRSNPTAAAAPAPVPGAANAATASAGAAAAGQTAACNRHFCQDRLASGEPGIKLSIIPAGSFTMGDADVAVERPAHPVTIRQSFAISTEEVSQAEYRWYCTKTGKPCPAQPSWAGDDYPVVNVSWTDATDYARWLSQMTGKHYRLPTEAEWEYAARAGQTGLFPQGDSLNPVDAYFSDKSKLTAPAPRSENKDFNPNPWHLYHMIGNVREWVEDSWEASFDGAPADFSAREKPGATQRVVRGGSYADGRPKLRLTTREALSPDTRDAVTGIRLVRELP